MQAKIVKQREKNESRREMGQTEIREEGKDKQNKWKFCSLHYAAGVRNPSQRDRILH